MIVKVRSGWVSMIPDLMYSTPFYYTIALSRTNEDEHEDRACCYKEVTPRSATLEPEEMYGKCESGSHLLRVKSWVQKCSVNFTLRLLYPCTH